jgi:predicted RNA-binding protein with RPS1 domain
MAKSIVLRNRIVRHVRVRAGDLVPHELNPRVHSAGQRRALEKLYEDIGIARSLLAYALPDGRLKLIDGHLRAEMNPDQEVDVEVLDVNDAEARALLLAIDPLAQLAGYEADTLAKLRQQAEQDFEAVKSLWQVIEEAGQKTKRNLDKMADGDLPEQFFVLIECADEAEQLAMLQRFQKEGLRCQAKLA